MTDSLHPRPAFVLAISAAMAVLPACSTEEIRHDPVFFPGWQPSANQGGLLIAFAPSENLSYVDLSMDKARYVFYDGAELSFDDGGHVQPLMVFEGGQSSMGYLPAGAHHFEVAGDLGRTTVFTGDGQIPPGRLTQLFLFGPAGAVQGRFVSYPALVAAGRVYLSLINLVRTGQSVEMVGCTDGSPCVPLSPPLALGASFAGDFPMDAIQERPNGPYVISNGAALGYRQVPTVAVPDPPVQPVFHSVFVDPAAPPATIRIAAPMFMSPTGDVQSSF